MPTPRWSSCTLVYEARAERGEESTRWAVEVDGRFRRAFQLPLKQERSDERHPYRGAQEIKGDEGTPYPFDDRREPGQIWELRVEVIAPVGTRIRKRTVFTDRPCTSRTGHSKDPRKPRDMWDYIEAGEIEPQRRYRNEMFVLWHGGRLIREETFRARQDKQRKAPRKSGIMLRGEAAASAAQALLRKLA